MTLRLNGSTSGYTEIDAPAAAGSNTLVLPTGNGSAGNILGTDGSGNLSWVNGRMVQGTSQASTSGTSIDFTGIPSWVKRVTVMFQGVSTSGSSNLLIQLGAGSVTTSGYTSQAVQTSSAPAISTTTSSAGLIISGAFSATALYSGCVQVVTLGSNAWASSGTFLSGTAGNANFSGGSITLSGTLDRIRITTVNGTDTFDAGSINILYEG